MFLFSYHNGHTFPTQVNSSTVTVFSRSIKDGTGIITSLFNTQRMVGWKIVKRQTPLVFMLYDFSSVISSPGSIINLVHLSIQKYSCKVIKKRSNKFHQGTQPWLQNLKKLAQIFKVSIHVHPSGWAIIFGIQLMRRHVFLLNNSKKRDITSQCNWPIRPITRV